MNVFRMSLCFVLAMAMLPVSATAGDRDGRYTVEEDGEFADAVQFAMLENHIRTMESCAKTLQELGDKPYTDTRYVRGQVSKRSSFYVRTVNMKEEAGRAIEKIIVEYFLIDRLGMWSVRKRTPGAYASQQYKDYTKMMERLHNALSYVYWARESTILEKPRMVRFYMREFREIYESPRNKDLRHRASAREWLTLPLH